MNRVRFLSSMHRRLLFMYGLKFGKAWASILFSVRLGHPNSVYRASMLFTTFKQCFLLSSVLSRFFICPTEWAPKIIEKKKFDEKDFEQVPFSNPFVSTIFHDALKISFKNEKMHIELVKACNISASNVLTNCSIIYSKVEIIGKWNSSVPNRNRSDGFVENEKSWSFSKVSLFERFKNTNECSLTLCTKCHSLLHRNQFTCFFFALFVIDCKSKLIWTSLFAMNWNFKLQ